MKQNPLIFALLLVLWVWLTAVNHTPFTRAAPTTDAVVGDGTPASCTEENFDNELTTVQNSGGGTLTFNCGGAASILFETYKVISNADVTIDGGGNITLSGGNAIRPFYVDSDASLTLQNITVSDGLNADYGGGAILNLGELTLANATVRGSNVDTGYSGGAIMSLDAPVTITDSLIENNSGGSAGGLYLLGENADATITGSTFRNNRALNASYGYGGAITTWNGADVTIQNTTLTQNQARYGGAIYNDQTNTTILIEGNSSLTENSSEDDGGGFFNANGQVTMTDVSITGNVAVGHGGGFHNNSSGQVELTNVIVSNNTTATDGGGIWNDRQGNVYNQVWTNLTVQNNNAPTGFGGGIYTSNASLIINTATISGNTSNRGGGIYFSQGDLTLSDLTIHNNTNGYGGGININDGTINIFDSTISNNEADFDGGGIYIHYSTLYAYRSTISGNLAGRNGGGINQYISTTNMTNVTISQNSAVRGGGLYVLSPGTQLADLKYVTFFDNTAGVSGNNIYTRIEGTLTLMLKNSILQSDTGDNCALENGTAITSAGFNLASDSSCNLNGTGDQENVDAQLGLLKDNGGPTLTHLPRLGSPALDSGQCVTGIATDQRGIARPQGVVCDRGAVERTPDDTDNFFVFLPVVIK